MNFDDEKMLEMAIDRELKRLPELAAPDTLASGVLARLGRRSPLPWYRRSWPTWAPALRAASLAALFAFFGALCFGGWQLSESESIAMGTREIGSWFSQIGVVLETVRVLLMTGMVVAKKCGPGFIAAFAVAAALGYGVCVGLGTMVVRVAVPRR